MNNSGNVNTLMTGLNELQTELDKEAVNTDSVRAVHQKLANVVSEFDEIKKLFTSKKKCH